MKVLVLAFSAVSLTACADNKLLPHESSTASAVFETYQQIETAYMAVTPGTTTTADLLKIGFDVKSAPNIEILSSVDIAARLPNTSRVSGQIPVEVQICIDAQEHCVAYLFHPERTESHHVGNTFLELGGFERKTINSGWSAEVVLLIRDNVVIYKHMVGRPRIEDMNHSVQPLGPLQNIGGSVTGTNPD